MRAFAAAFLLLALGSAPLRAAAPTEARFFPQRFRVGEEVLLVLVPAEVPEGIAPFSLKPGAGLPTSLAGLDPEVRELSLARRGGAVELRIRFVPWTSGPGRIPAFSAMGLSQEALPYQCDSVLGPLDREPAPPKPQLDPPGAFFYLYGLSGLLILLVLGGGAAALWLIPAARALLGLWRAAEARKELERRLDWLSTGGMDASPEAFYAVLERSLRRYLALRVLPGAESLTAEELAASPDSDWPGPDLRPEAAALARESTEARYARRDPGRAGRERTIARARELARRAEEALHART